MPVHGDVTAGMGWAIDHGADVIAITGCGTAPPKAARAAATAHGVPVYYCQNESEAYPTAAIAGITGLMLTCNPALTPTETREILQSTPQLNAYWAVRRAGCSAKPAEIVRLIVRTRGQGTVRRSPDDDTYNAGTVVVLRAKAKTGWRFARWNGLCRGTRATCTVRLMQSGVTTAVFKRR
jgi:Divergent InlB B-repeat domain